MVVMTEVLAQLVESLASGLPQAMADIYGMQQDGSVPEQLQLQSDFKMAELQRAHELQRVQAAWESTLRVDEHIETARADANPFGYQSREDAHRQVQRITHDGERPALLFAPFLNVAGSVQENLDNPYGYVHSLRASWNDSPWRGEVAADVGTIAKPLVRTDWDARQIRELLADLPVVLVYGVVRENRRPRLEILAWNIIDDQDGRTDSEPIKITIPERATGTIEPDELPDQLSLASTQLCAMLAEWFHVARGRLPCRHRDITPGLQRATAAGTLVALRLGVDLRRLDPVTATIHQAMVHADLGEAEALADALDFVRRTADLDTAERQLRLLRDTFAAAATTSGTNDAAARPRSRRSRRGDQDAQRRIRARQPRLYREQAVMAASARPGNFRVVAAIDFGTHSTGYAWVPVNEHNDVPARREIKVHTEWPDQPVRGAKTLSAVLLDADHSVQAWGYTARQKRGTRSASAPGRYHQAFKLDLHGGSPGQDTETGPTRTGLTRPRPPWWRPPSSARSSPKRSARSRPAGIPTTPSAGVSPCRPSGTTTR